MPHCVGLSFVVGQAISPHTSKLGWMIGALNSVSSLMALVSGLLIFAGACYLIATRRRPAVLAACLVFLPLPSLIALCGCIDGNIRSLNVMASSPDLTVTSADIAGGVANMLVNLLAALLISAPSYFVLAFGLLFRSMNSSSGPTAAVPVRTERPAPFLNLAGTAPIATLSDSQPPFC